VSKEEFDESLTDQIIVKYTSEAAKYYRDTIFKWFYQLATNSKEEKIMNPIQKGKKDDEYWSLVDI